MGTRRSDSPLFPLWERSSAQYLLGFWWVRLGFGYAAVLGTRAAWLGHWITAGGDEHLPKVVGSSDIQRPQYWQLLDIEVAGYLGQLRKKETCFRPVVRKSQERRSQTAKQCAQSALDWNQRHAGEGLCWKQPSTRSLLH